MKLIRGYVVIAGAWLLCVFGVIDVWGQASTSAPPARGVIRLRVRPKIGDAVKGLARKRFFLFAGSLEENRALVEKMTATPFMSREAYYRKLGASAALIKWLAVNDCESVYCREIAAQDVEGEAAVPEFQKAFAQGRREFGNRDLARKWLTVNLREEIRSGFYHQQQETIRALLAQAEAQTKTKPLSVMTDRNGTAYFTDLTPGAYLISNLIPAEIGAASVLWNCEIIVKAGELATERPFLISNVKDKNVKCVGIERAGGN